MVNGHPQSIASWTRQEKNANKNNFIHALDYLRQGLVICPGVLCGMNHSECVHPCMAPPHVACYALLKLP